MAEQQIISAVASSSNSSSTVSPKEYDVFLSFRGEDTRMNFTSHLHEALEQKKVETYIDYRLKKGDEISPALIKAIKDSHISVVILSENYASSKWCLEELSKILECRKKKGQIVIPVFYNVDPSHVRKQTGSYKKAFKKHKGEHRCNKWKAALTEVANLAGWDSRDRTESELLKDIVGDILRKLTSSCQNQLKGFVGIEENLEQIESLLKIWSGGVKTIGIWGMGGIGKTTLAKALYAKLSPEFEVSCFLANVRENLEKLGLETLRSKLFSQLLEQKHLPPFLLSNFDKRRLEQKKVLIVLDDVTTFKKLEDLIEDFVLLGSGSRVVVTTRNKEIFSQKVEVFEIKKLSFYHSLQLFCLTAFEEKQPKQGYEYLSRSAISYCSGIPLALKVLGASLRRRRSKEAWESELRKLEKIPNTEIHEILKLSYDDLDESQKDVFLDIACFFKGISRDWVTNLLEACEFFAASGIEVLLDKALITISDFGCIEMHDLIQQMGREIVRQESTKDGERSRLWKHEEVYEVLKVNTGTDVVQGIALDLCKLTRDLELDSDSFTKMTKLRFLKIHDGYLREKKFNVYFPRKGLTSLSNKLRYLHWDRCCLESLPSNFCAEQLVELHMPDSKVKKLWDGVQNIVNLKKIDLSNSQELIEIPDLSKAEKLETVIFDGCENLSGTTIESLAANIKFLPLLKTLHLDGCSKLMSLPELPPSLSQLQLKGCSQLVSLPELPPSLSDLWLHGCSNLVSLPKLPPSLSDISLDGCSQLVSLPKLPLSLSHLQLEGCNQLVSLPELPSSLSELDLMDCSQFVSLPELPPSLCHLRLGGCGQLVSLPELPPSLRHLWLGGCGQLVSLPELPPSLRQLRLKGYNQFRSLPNLPPSLRQYELEGCSQLVSLPELPPSLHHLLLEDCSKLVSLPELPPSLGHLQLEGCSKLVSLPELPPSLGYLELVGCSKVVSLPQLPPSLSHLLLKGCSQLMSLPELPPSLSHLQLEGYSQLVSLLELPPSLSDLRLDGYSQLVSLPKLPPSLSHLQLEGCSQLVSLPELPSSLSQLQLEGCIQLVSLLELPPSLHHLSLKDCSKLVSLPELPPSLSYLRLEGCSQLVSLLELPPSLSYLRLKGCGQLMSLPELPPSLSHLLLEGCGQLVSLPELPSSLWRLRLEGCSQLVSLPVLPLSLSQLQLEGCSQLVSLPELPPSLFNLWLDGCSKLVSLPELPPSLNVLWIVNCTSLDTDLTQHLLLQHMLQPGQLLCRELECDYYVLPGEYVTDNCEFRTTGSTIAIPSLPLSHPESHLHAFISYIIYSAGLFKGDVFYSIYQHGEKVGWGHKLLFETNLISNHMVLFHVKCKRSHIFRNDLPFEFKLDIHDQAERIRECGVFPVYASESGGLKLFDRSSKQTLDSESISHMSDNESQHTRIRVGGSNSQHEKEWEQLLPLITSSVFF